MRLRHLRSAAEGVSAFVGSGLGVLYNGIGCGTIARNRGWGVGVPGGWGSMFRLLTVRDCVGRWGWDFDRGGREGGCALASERLWSIAPRR